MKWEGIVWEHWPDTDWNQLHGPMHYKIGVTCVYNGQCLLYSGCNSRREKHTFKQSFHVLP